MIGSPEFQLALECCRRNFRNAEERVLTLDVDWPVFHDLVRFHRIEGLVHRALRNEASIPSGIAEKLSDAAASIAAQNLRSAAACHLLIEAFEARLISILFVKGLTLGVLAYGNGAVKSAIDIDILIDPDDLEAAADCLHATRFRLAAPSKSLLRWHRSWKESVWLNDQGMQLDLHVRLADNPRMLSDITVHAPSRRVEVAPGIALPTLSDDELITYLAVHGASAGWFRLKWISDFAALLAGRSGAEIVNLYEHSQALGAGRAAGQGLLLADALFKTLADLPLLSQRLRSDRSTLRLFRIALRLLARGPAEPTKHPFGTLPIHLSQVALQAGPRFAMSQITQQVRQLITRVTI
jgi:hypothetical protein